MLNLPEGYTYRAKHERIFPDGEIDPAPRGGKTIVAVGYLVTVKDEEEPRLRFEEVVRGEARCSPRDTFSKKRGRDIALGRALKKLELS